MERNCLSDRIKLFVVVFVGGFPKRPMTSMVDMAIGDDFNKESFLVGRFGKKAETINSSFSKSAALV